MTRFYSVILIYLPLFAGIIRIHFRQRGREIRFALLAFFGYKTVSNFQIITNPGRGAYVAEAGK